MGEHFFSLLRIQDTCLLLGACLDLCLAQAMPRPSCKCLSPPTPDFAFLSLAINRLRDLEQASCPFWPLVSSSSKWRDWKRWPRRCHVALDVCVLRAPVSQRLSVSSLRLLGLSPRAVDGKGPAAHRIKYLSCRAKNWVSCSHRAACAQGICRAPHGP